MTPTLQKLRYKPGMRVCVLGAPVGFQAELTAARRLTRSRALRGQFDLVQVFFTRRAQLERDAAKLRAALLPKGILWVCYPKGQGLGTDLNRDILRASAADAGLQVVANVAIDSVWSAVRCKAVALRA